MIQSETDKAFEQSKKSLTKEEKVKERMAALRAKRKPPKLKGIHSSVLELPEDDTLSYKNIKKWIETQQGIVRATGLVERSRTRDISKKERDKKMRERMAAQGYVTSMQRYLRTGDWDNLYFGEYEEHLTKWKVIAPAGDK